MIDPLEMVEVCQSWWGRSRAKMTETMSLFFCHTVKPCMDIEPGHGLKLQYLNQLIDFLASKEGTSQRDLEMIKQISTGKLQRHPALHGVAGPTLVEG
jgi:hypothetical protein